MHDDLCYALKKPSEFQQRTDGAVVALRGVDAVVEVVDEELKPREAQV